MPPHAGLEMRSFLPASALLVCTLAPIATAQPVAGTVRDSAGIAIVEHSTFSRPAATLRIDPRPAFALGGLSDDENQELDSRQPWLSLTRLSNGGFVVNEMTQLKFFGSDGRFLRTAGRAGSGPGEFRQTREVCPLPGDSLLVIDYSVGTLTIWSQEGTHLRTIARPGFIPLNGCRPDGSIILQGDVPTGIAAPAAPRSAEYRIARLDGTVVGTLGRFALGTFAGPISFETSLKPFRDGFLHADPGTGAITLLSPAGAVQRIIRATAPRRAPSEEDWRERVLNMVPRNSSAENRERLVTRMMPLRPSTMPAFGRVFVDSEDRLWVHESMETQRYNVLSRTGALLGQVEIPEGRLANFLPGHVVVLHRDADGASVLRAHRILVN